MGASGAGDGSSIGKGHRSGSSSIINADDSSTIDVSSSSSSEDVIAALDQGTQSTRVFLYRASDMAVVASHQVELTQHFPRPGWVEHDPMEILSSVALCAGGALAAARAGSRSNLSSGSTAAKPPPSPRVVALGITNQRESTIAWDRKTGRPLHRSIVWNDGRTAEICARVEREHGGKDCFRAVTGLPVSPYFSAYKMLWLLENVPAVKKAAEEGRLAFGTVDSWLIFHLTGGSNSNRKGDGSSCSSSSTPPASPTFVTDVTNASRTGLLCLKTRAWHLETCGKLGIDVAWLARIASSAEVYGKVAAPLSSSSENIAEMVRDKASLYRTCSGESGFVSGNPSSTSGNNKSSSDEATVVSWSCRSLAGVPISGCLGDQQAALLGQRCRVGEAKATYGTGAFVLLVTGSEAPVPSSSGLLTTAAYQLGADAPLFYALEGAVAVAGAGVSWLRDGFGIIERPQEVEELARSVEDSCGVVLVPAFAGLLAPRWRADARGVIVGLTSATTKAHLARAMLDAIGWQTKEVVEAMALDRSSAMGSKAEKGAAAASSAAEEESKTNSSPSSSVAAISRLRVDGGASRNDLLMEIQADLLGLPVERPAHGETTSLGAALAAGVGAGVFSSAEEAFTVGVGAAPSVFLPKAKREDVARAYEKWNDAVERSYGLAG